MWLKVRCLRLLLCLRIFGWNELFLPLSEDSQRLRTWIGRYFLPPLLSHGKQKIQKGAMEEKPVNLPDLDFAPEFQPQTDSAFTMDFSEMSNFLNFAEDPNESSTDQTPSTRSSGMVTTEDGISSSMSAAIRSGFKGRSARQNASPIPAECKKQLFTCGASLLYTITGTYNYTGDWTDFRKNGGAKRPAYQLYGMVFGKGFLTRKMMVTSLRSSKCFPKTAPLP